VAVHKCIAGFRSHKTSWQPIDCSRSVGEMGKNRGGGGGGMGWGVNTDQSLCGIQKGMSILTSAVRNIHKQVVTLTFWHAIAKKVWFFLLFIKLLDKIHNSKSVVRKRCNLKSLGYWRRIKVKPVQSWGVLMRPQPSRLGLIEKRELLNRLGYVSCIPNRSRSTVL
jgi:hypothetical protein